jgi:hypothetical protein
MTVTHCYSNTLRSAMQKLEQANSVLLAEAAERESELSLLREAVMFYYGVVTVPNAVSLAEEEAGDTERMESVQKLLQREAPWEGTTSAPVYNYLVQSENSLPPNCT